MLGVYSFLRKLAFVKIPLKCNSIKTVKMCTKPLDVNTNVTKDVILYKYHNSRYFNLMNIFAICQFGFWTYLSVISLKTLRDVPVQETDREEKRWWEKINLGENKYRNGIAAFSFLVGFGILSFTWLYSLRSVKYLILRKGGKQITIVTYTPTMINRMFTVNLSDLSSKDTRQAAKSHIALKVKGHSFYYLMDMKGEFQNPTLFDYTAGLSRSWKV
nr:transmembrane protein 223 [Leptinotarsa decemlineata]